MLIPPVELAIVPSGAGTGSEIVLLSILEETTMVRVPR